MSLNSYVSRPSLLAAVFCRVYHQHSTVRVCLTIHTGCYNDTKQGANQIHTSAQGCKGLGSLWQACCPLVCRLGCVLARASYPRVQIGIAHLLLRRSPLKKCKPVIFPIPIIPALRSTCTVQPTQAWILERPRATEQQAQSQHLKSLSGNQWQKNKKLPPAPAQVA